MTNPYNVNFGSIPFSPAPGGMFANMGGSPQQAMAGLGPAYQQSYEAALGFNKALGDTINTGYNNAMQQQMAGQQGIMNMIAGYGGSARQGLIDQNVKNQGDMTQSMISRGLGNYTVLDAGKRGLDADYQKANLQLEDQLAAMRANYQNQFNLQNTGLSQAHMGFLERMTGQYPNAGLYAQLAQQYGAAGQSAANQRQIQDALRQMGGGGFGMRSAGGGIGGGGQGRAQTASYPYGGYNYIAAPDGIGYGGAGAWGAAANPNYNSGWNDKNSTIATDPNEFYGYGWAGGGLSDADVGTWGQGIIDQGEPDWLNMFDEAGGNPQFNDYGYGWDNDGWLSYDPSMDFSDGQWAGADWAYID